MKYYTVCLVQCYITSNIGQDKQETEEDMFEFKSSSSVLRGAQVNSCSGGCLFAVSVNAVQILLGLEWMQLLPAVLLTGLICVRPAGSVNGLRCQQNHEWFNNILQFDINI